MSTKPGQAQVQECFLDVYRGLRGFHGGAKLSTWVYRIAIRAALRTRAKRPEKSDQLEDALNHPMQAPGPDDVAAARQGARRLEQALAQLSLEQRTVLSLFAVDGLGHDEIAEVLGIPTGTVWSRLHTARKRLATLL